MPNIPVYVGSIRWEGKVVGTAFLVHKRGLIATCYHILKVAGDSPVGKVFSFEFLHDNLIVDAVVTNRLDPVNDVALLQVTQELPPSTIAATLINSNAVDNGSSFSLSGVGQLDDPGHSYEYISAIGKVVGSMKRDNVSVLQLESKQILKGISGSPVVIEGLDGVMGMISGRYTPPKDKAWMEHTAWAVKSDVIAQLDSTIEILDPATQLQSRQERYLSITIKRLRTDYLRAMYAQYRKVKLSYFLEAVNHETVDITEVFVPLKVNLCFNLAIKNNSLYDWWILSQPGHDTEQNDPGDIGEEEARAKFLADFTPQKEALEQFLPFMFEHIAVEQGKNGVLEDGIYEWNNLDAEAGLSFAKHIVVSGDPGSGKSTLLRHIALAMAGELLNQKDESTYFNLKNLSFWPFPAKTPIFVELRSLTKVAFPDLDDQVTVDKFLSFIESEQLRPNRLDEYISDLHDQMQDGNAIILLDGLDEVPNAADPKRREQIKTLANLLIVHYPLCRIIITSRPYAYAGDWRLTEFDHLSLTTLDRDGLNELTRKLLRILLGEKGIKRAYPKFADYLETIPAELLSNPLLATLVSSIWLNGRQKNQDGSLPVSKAALYRECINALLKVWVNKDVPRQNNLVPNLGFEINDLPRILEQLAFRLYNDYKGSSSSGSQTDGQVFESGLIMTVVRQIGIQGADYDKLLDILAQRAGIVYEKSPNLFQFVHRTFQEYLAARYILNDDFPRGASRYFKEDPALWHDTAILLIEEAQYKGQSLWPLVRELLPEINALLPTSPNDIIWQNIAYVARLMDKYLPISDELQLVYRPQLRRSLASLVALGALSSIERAEMGRLLAGLGDPRLGVGLQKNGLPDIDWVDVHEGNFLFGPDNTNCHLPSFKISRYPITYSQYQSFIDAEDGYYNPQWWNGLSELPENPKQQCWPYQNHPREEVNWFEAMAFCRWLSTKVMYEVRLPTEQEWEKAARGFSGFIYPYGNDFDANKGNTSETHIGLTTAVGIFPNGASPFGVFDMSGNVWHWCLTKWQHSQINDLDANDPRGDRLRVVRGGSRSSTKQDSSAVASFSRDPHNHNNNIGFRIVCNNDIGIEKMLAQPVIELSEESGKKINGSDILFITPKNKTVITDNKLILQNPGERFTTLSINHLGSRLAFGGSSGRVSILSLGVITSKQLEKIPGHNETVRVVKFHPSKGIIVSAADDGVIKLSSPFENLYKTIGRHAEPVYSVAFHPKGEIIASAGRGGVIKLWDISQISNIPEQPELEPSKMYDKSAGAVFAVDFDGTGDLLAAAYDEGVVYIQNTKNGSQQVLTGFAGAVLCVKFDISGHLLAATGQDRTVRVWNLETGTQKVFVGHSAANRWVSFSPNGRFVLSASKDQTMVLWDLFSDSSWILSGHKDYLYCAEFHPDGTRIYSASGDGTIREWLCPRNMTDLK